MCSHHPRVRPWLLGAGLFLLTEAAHAQSSDSARAAERPLQRVVITATRAEVPAQTSATSVISGAELRARGVTHLIDALREIPGLHLVQTGSFGGATSLYMRGGESGYTRVLVDGMPINDPGGDFDFSQLTTEDVERVEIVRGPSSVLYGSDAVSGVVQIFTIDGRGAPAIRLGVQGGSYGSWIADAAAQGGTEEQSFSVAMRHHETDGIYEINNRYRHRGVSGSARLLGAYGIAARVLVRHADDVAHVPTDGSGAVVDTNARSTAERTTLSIELERAFGTGTRATLALASHVTTGGFDDAPDGPGDTLGFFAYKGLDHVTRRRAELLLHHYAGGVGTVSLGGSLEGQRQRSLNQSRSEFGDDAGRLEASRTTRAIFAQLAGARGPLSWSAGSRVDGNDAFGTFDTHRIGVGLAVAQQARLRAAIGTAFREPTFFQNFATGFVLGNPDLRPEHSTAWEVGLDQQWWNDRLVLATTWFRQRFRDIIEYTFSPPAPTDPNYFNVASARASGVELEAHLSAGRGVRLDVSHSILETRVDNPGFDASETAYFRAGERLLRRPRHTSSAAISWSASRGGGASARWTYVGNRPDLDFDNGARVILPSYATLDLSGSVALPHEGDTYSLTLRVANALDREYEAVRGFRAPGRTVLVGVALQR